MNYFPTEPATFRRNNFDFLRFALALAVLFAHSWPLASGSNTGEPILRLTGGWNTAGGVAVLFFFVISGFLVTHSWRMSGGPADFFRKRICRIYPGLVVAIVLCAFVVAPLGSDGHMPFRPLHRLARVVWLSTTVEGYVGVGVFTSNPYPSAINGSLWTIRYELLCYVALGAIGACGLLGRRRTVVVLFVAALTVSAARTFFGLRLGSDALDTWVLLGTYFLAGAVFYLYRDSIPNSHAAALGAAAALSVSVLAPKALALTTPVCGTYLVFYLAFSRWLPFQSFGRWGDFSYGIYLYAFPIQQLVVMGLGPMTPLALFGLATPLSVAAGVISWYVVERRFIHRRRPKVSRCAVPEVVAATASAARAGLLAIEPSV